MAGCGRVRDRGRRAAPVTGGRERVLVDEDDEELADEISRMMSKGDGRNFNIVFTIGNMDEEYDDYDEYDDSYDFLDFIDDVFIDDFLKCRFFY